MSSKKIVILGCGGNCIDILETIDAINSCSDRPVWDCIGFLDDDPSILGQTFQGKPVLGKLNSATRYDDCHFVNGIGSPGNFWKKPDIIASTGLAPDRFSKIIHPTSSVSPSAKLGSGTVVLQQVTVASNVTIGRHVIILPNTVISHDDHIGDYTCIAGGVCVSSAVTVGPCCYLGTNCSLIGDIEIGERSMIGMGAVVLADVDPNSVMVGNPAGKIRTIGAR